MFDKSESITLTKRCRVCGDPASGFHFSAISCASCKAFFQRAVFKKDLKCEHGNNCKINQTTRTNCMKCRFKKELVSYLPKRINLPKPNPTVLPIDRMRLLSNESSLNLKLVELSRLEELYKAVQAFPYLDSARSCPIVGQVDNVSQLVHLTVGKVQHIIRFCKNMTEFNCLTKDEQVIAIRSLVPEINLIKAAFNFDTEANGWAALQHPECDKRAVFIKMDIFKSWPNQKNIKFFSSYIIDLNREMENDHAIRDLILAQLVFRNRPKIRDNLEFVRYHHVVFHYLLCRYLEHKYLDKSRAAQKYTSLMDLLAKMDIIANGA